MGAVYRATDLTLARPVALKIMHRQFANQPEFQQRFMQEAQAAARLNHPSIVTVYNFDSKQGLLYIVMEYVPGMGMGAYIKQLIKREQVIKLSETLFLIAQAAEGVLQNDEGEDLRVVAVDGETLLGGQVEMTEGGGFTYTSGVRLPTASGFMTGAYQMLGADGLWFDAVIPAFALDEQVPIVDALEAAGVTAPFDDPGDDLAPMGMASGQGLDAFVHRATLGLDADGVHLAGEVPTSPDDAEAAPAGAIRFDRTFVFVVHDAVNGTPILLGRITDPTAS